MKHARRSPARRRLAVALAAFICLPAFAAPPLVTLVFRDGGKPVLNVTDAHGLTLVDETLGLRTADADLSDDLRLMATSQRPITERYRMTVGKRLDRSANLSETRYALQNGKGQKLDVVVRVANDGVAFRYELPGVTQATVTGESTSFTVPADAPAWLLPYGPQYENERIQTTAAGAAPGDYGYPSLFRVGGSYVLITEANADGRYDGSRLSHVAGTGTYGLTLADPRVESTGVTPWRTVITGDLATVTESTLVDDLADPARFADTSWIKPGKVAWSWLSEHDSPSNVERQRAYVDFAARNRIPYVLVDEGWSDAWVPDLVRYANAKHVDILLWFHWSKLDTPAKRMAELEKVKSWGVKGVKVDFMESDSQARYRWYDDTLADTAKLHLMLNFHGATIPHGLARTWPHLMTMEGVRGAENDPPAVGNTIQPYTRNVVGSMDYTPVAFDAGRREATIAHEVALPIVFESGWTHLADKPEAYERRPHALAFLDQIPTVWDETKFIAGTPGQDAVFARRSGDRWFIGAIAAGPARRLTVPLASLGVGPWHADVVRDGSGRGDVVRSAQNVTADSSLSFDVPVNGGFAAILCPLAKGQFANGCFR
ncbi:glycoside hydrolase family 97 catalytic domain-containing protein [Luteibacter flocculans]|uniref:Glycoside hydrolase family 97 catalytic domain-containing protein n=1 Tax=Luteibacter flocculans TaxID=2780091 RepID=A0ABY4SYT9_9GAMM|nr:glycoside hydrolase family 97 protein [Luteibacter flocculans]URL57878.1 glycoside hydrolase family 97 catalytic domain-containing protein [Luteibacter flocculans]